MQEKKFLYFLLDETGRSYYLQNGVVKTSAVARHLAHTPDGWDNITIAFDRDLTRVGLSRSFTIPLSFVRDGATILRKLFHSGTIEQRLFLLIKKFDLQIDEDFIYPVHRYLYRGELDLS
ncbi:MAG: hypothetical protein V4615_04865, partial [Bacteroidota bacterium]